MPIARIGDEHESSGLARADVFTVRGMPGVKVPMPMIVGLDLAGEILEVGPGVNGWKRGERVLVNPVNRNHGLMGEMLHGGLAERCLVLPLERAAEGLKLIENREVFGKVVVTPG